MKFLIIYENVPETTDLFVVETSDSEEIKDLRVIHGHYINAEENEEILDTCTRWYYKLYGETTWADKEEYSKYGVQDNEVGKYFKNKIDSKEMISVKSLDIDYVVVTGFIC